ncbi:hypothetical protein U1Q18_013125 [Sarracenia purpurea var. burkii]
MSEDEERASPSDLGASSGAIETPSLSSSSKSCGCTIASGGCREYTSSFSDLVLENGDVDEDLDLLALPQAPVVTKLCLKRLSVRDEDLPISNHHLHGTTTMDRPRGGRREVVPVKFQEIS